MADDNTPDDEQGTGATPDDEQASSTDDALPRKA
ncbi:hypothetical protein BC477_06915 [Clavibacter michiganensis subsp. michiganensis]|uniref:Uncharacterized protein n=1 Tax=Clavibacter michiganensis subsp. michiganensis TaxID=33013 RepID=A0A251XM24_CLAMM|nr:hypothetical protein BC477_06915 [Clavibacter michiganensis subsp. michiganensis]OUE04450.1 hypothetical protein CMMCAS07_05845 [Clavibacter michiganensis subsp. michiganensis]